MPSLLWKTDLDPGPALVAAGRVVDEKGDVAAASGSQVFVFIPADGEYQPRARLDLEAAVTGLAAGRRGPAQESREFFVASTSEKIFLLGGRQGTVAILAQTGREPGAGFTNVAAGDLDGDGVVEIAAAASGQGALFVYRTAEGAGGEISLELVGIRVVPGTPRLVEVLARPERRPAVAVAFEEGGKSGVAVFSLAEEGFEAGPLLEGLPFRITGLAAGDFAPRPGPELALGGSGGMVWLVGAGERLEVILVTDSLGTSVSALAASEEGTPRLAAGTPEGNVFVFNYPVGRSPNLAFSVVEGVGSLAAVPGGRVAVGTDPGGVQVWSLSGSDPFRRYIVRPGDTLWKIAGMFGVTVEQILAVNDNVKNPDLILPGQIVKIPVY